MYLGPGGKMYNGVSGLTERYTPEDVYYCVYLNFLNKKRNDNEKE